MNNFNYESDVSKTSIIIHKQRKFFDKEEPFNYTLFKENFEESIITNNSFYFQLHNSE